jgi:hypothetical protein
MSESAGPPAVRASDAEREAVVARLQTAAGDGRLALEELADRLERALSAATRPELEVLTADLPEQSAPAPPAAKARRWIVGIMGGGDHKGRWRIASRCNVVNVMGGADLDLTGAVVEGPETAIQVFSLMGGSNIVVPDGVHVELRRLRVHGRQRPEARRRAAAPAGRPGGSRAGLLDHGRHGRQARPTTHQARAVRRNGSPLASSRRRSSSRSRALRSAGNAAAYAPEGPTPLSSGCQRSPKPL